VAADRVSDGPTSKRMPMAIDRLRAVQCRRSSWGGRDGNIWSPWIGSLALNLRSNRTGFRSAIHSFQSTGFRVGLAGWL
jgi:hypothetical protein